jgi:hypothetical protein
LKSIDKIGVELEGSWPGEKGVAPFEDVDIQHDGSVDKELDCQHYGEINSPPFEDLNALVEWMKLHYPKSNKSCGFHIHVSLKKIRDYSRLMERKFDFFFNKEISAWAKKTLRKDDLFWERFSGKNRFCLTSFTPESQVVQKGKGGDRYARINFCFTLHGTLELRLFPMWKDFSLSESGLREFIRIVETYLEMCRKERIQKGKEKEFLRIKVGDLLKGGKSVSNRPR